MKKMLSIDVGYGYVKAVTLKDKVTFPTVCMRENREKLINENIHDYEIKIDGIAYRIGSYGLMKGGQRVWSSTRQINSDTFLYVATSAHLLCNPDDEIDLCLGLPYGFYRDLNKGEQLIKELSGKKFSTEIGEERKNFKISSVSVFPQGTGAYMSRLAYLDENNKLQMKINNQSLYNSIVVDIGFRTTDVITMAESGKTLTLQENASFSNEELGISNAIEKIADKVSSAADAHVSSDEIESVISKGETTIFVGEDIDFSEYQEDAYQELAENIYKYINQRIGNVILRYKNVFLSGGGALALYPYLKKFWPRLEKQDDSTVYENALGYLVLRANAMLLANAEDHSSGKETKAKKVTK